MSLLNSFCSCLLLCPAAKARILPVLKFSLSLVFLVIVLETGSSICFYVLCSAYMSSVTERTQTGGQGRVRQAARD